MQMVVEPLAQPFRYAAQLINVSIDTLDRWEKAKLIRVVKYGTHRYLASEEIQRIIREGVGVAKQPAAKRAAAVKKPAAKVRTRAPAV